MRQVAKITIHRTYKWNCSQCRGRITSPVDPCSSPGAGKGIMYVCPHCDHRFCISHSGYIPDEPLKGL